VVLGLDILGGLDGFRVLAEERRADKRHDRGATGLLACKEASRGVKLFSVHPGILSLTSP
jgi:hypothetical protein